MAFGSKVMFFNTNFSKTFSSLSISPSETLMTLPESACAHSVFSGTSFFIKANAGVTNKSIPILPS